MKKIFLTTLIISLVLVCTTTVFAAEDVFSASERFFGDIQIWIIRISTPAALIGVGSGAFMKKFSFGDHQKIKMGNMVIFSSLIGWTVINGLTLILTTIQKYIN